MRRNEQESVNLVIVMGQGRKSANFDRLRLLYSQTKPMPSIPVDVLQHILEHVDRASLIKICLVNKVCCSCSQDILYRDIRINAKHFNITKICQTLNESTHLAKRVRSFEINVCNYVVHRRNEQELQKALQNMTCLRRLRLDDPEFCILFGCTFKLDSFSSDGDFTEEFHRFLCNQPSLTDLQIGKSRGSDVAWGPCLPNLTRVAAHFSQLQHFISNRPVNEVISYGFRSYNESIDLSFFALSAAPIQKLSIHYTYLYSAPSQLLASIFPSLTHLTLKPAPWEGGVASERFLFINQ
jgi:hypothetical protein